jgi:hypothetical protein
VGIINLGLRLNVFPYVHIPQAGTLQASAGEQVLQTDITDHDGLMLPALVDCPIDSPLKVRKRLIVLLQNVLL